jgi:hypothetical protein
MQYQEDLWWVEIGVVCDADSLFDTRHGSSGLEQHFPEESTDQFRYD